MTTVTSRVTQRGYCHSTPAGIPIPYFVIALINDDNNLASSRWKLFEHRAFQMQRRHWPLIGFLLELAHRRHLTTLLYQLRTTLARIRQPSYDLAPAETLLAEYKSTFWPTVTLSARAAEENELKPRNEVQAAVSQLPTGPIATLALMR